MSTQVKISIAAIALARNPLQMACEHLPTSFFGINLVRGYEINYWYTPATGRISLHDGGKAELS